MHFFTHPERSDFLGAHINRLHFLLNLPFFFTEKSGILLQIEKGNWGKRNLKAVLNEQNLFCSLASPIQKSRQIWNLVQDFLDLIVLLNSFSQQIYWATTMCARHYPRFLAQRSVVCVVHPHGKSEPLWIRGHRWEGRPKGDGLHTHTWEPAI